MKRQEALDLAKEHLCGIQEWLNISTKEKGSYCPIATHCEVCETLFEKWVTTQGLERDIHDICPCRFYGAPYILRRIKQLAKEQGIDLRKEVKPS